MSELISESVFILGNLTIFINKVSMNEITHSTFGIPVTTDLRFGGKRFFHIQNVNLMMIHRPTIHPYRNESNIPTD